mmetsp:Transcript_4756/g.12761  ORF Transcript_4756/g.12761 Transcript_4756/m.12761 type:complete len:264 (-) Transcript_4756:1017-1808(-)
MLTAFSRQLSLRTALTTCSRSRANTHGSPTMRTVTSPPGTAHSFSQPPCTATVSPGPADSRLSSTQESCRPLALAGTTTVLASHSMGCTPTTPRQAPSAGISSLANCWRLDRSTRPWPLSAADEWPPGMGTTSSLSGKTGRPSSRWRWRLPSTARGPTSSTATMWLTVPSSGQTSTITWWMCRRSRQPSGRAKQGRGGLTSCPALRVRATCWTFWATQKGATRSTGRRKGQTLGTPCARRCLICWDMLCVCLLRIRGRRGGCM